MVRLFCYGLRTLIFLDFKVWGRLTKVATVWYMGRVVYTPFVFGIC